MSTERLRENSNLRVAFDRYKVVSERSGEFVPPSMVMRALRDLNLNPSTIEVSKRLGHADENKVGMLSFEEFISLYAQFAHSQHRVQKAIDDFMILDTNQDGVLDRNELYQKLSVVAPGERLSDSEFDAFFREIDVDNDNEITVLEFAGHMCPDVDHDELVNLIKGYKSLDKSPALKCVDNEESDNNAPNSIRENGAPNSARANGSPNSVHENGSPVSVHEKFSPSPVGSAPGSVRKTPSPKTPTIKTPTTVPSAAATNTGTTTTTNRREGNMTESERQSQTQQVEEARRKLGAEIQSLRTAQPVDTTATQQKSSAASDAKPKENNEPAKPPKPEKVRSGCC